MATVTSTPTASSLTVSGTTQKNGTISWTKPTVPSGATITSCKLSFEVIEEMKKGSVTVTVDGMTVNAGGTYTTSLGTTNNITSVTTTAKGNKNNSSGTVSFTNLVYTVTYELAKATYTVTFKDWNGTTLKTQTVEEGASATAPSDPVRDGYTFTGWDVSFSNVTSNLTVTAQYEKIEVVYYTVTFVDWDGTVLKTEQVEQGKDATAPSEPTRDGYIFKSWDLNFFNVQRDLTVTAQYVEDSEEPEASLRIEPNPVYVVSTTMINEGYNRVKVIMTPAEGYFNPANFTWKYTKGSGSFTSQPDGGCIIRYSRVDSEAEITVTDSVTGHTASCTIIPITCTVTFKDWDGTLLKEQRIMQYGSATAPSNPTREGYIFTGWDKSFNNVTSDLTVTAQYTESPEEPEEPDLTEPVDGYIAKNLVSYGDWSYTFNVDWDTQYLDIEVLNYEYGVFRTDYYYIISNNSYNANYSHESMDNFTIHDVEVESRPEDIDIIRYSKVDGVCIITSNGTQIIPGNAFANDNKTTIEAVIPTEWMVSEDGYMTFNIKITDIASSEEDIIEWTGVGTVATGLRAHDVEHDNYKINIDWDTQYFDIIVTEDFNCLNGRMDINFASLDDLIIGGNKYITTLQVVNGIMGITIYDPSNKNPDYNFERNYPFTIRLAKEGIYALHGSTSHLIMERDYNLEAIYFNEDRLDNEPVNNYENGDYDIAFDLVVSERSGQTEEPEEDVIEWTGIGTVATGLNSGIKHSNYKINLDWDNEYFDIILQDYTMTGDVAAAYVCDIRINNNTYNYYFIEGCIALRQEGQNLYECEPYMFPITLRFAKDGIYCLYDEENVQIYETEYGNDDVIYILEDNKYSTDFSIEFNLVVSEYNADSEEPEIPEDNDLVQGDITEDGTFDDESTTVVRTKYIDISDKKSIRVNVLTDNVYISAAYLYNANKELVKVIEIPEGKKRMFGVNLEQLIAQLLEEEEGDK